jgi:ribosome biogenesis GTPase
MATPLIVLTKADLCGDLDRRLIELEKVSVGTDFVVCSSMTGDGYDQVRSYIKEGNTIAFIGSSGVGKSTLINRLIGGEVMTTKGIREDDGKGRHTTTHRQLLVLPEGGIVIDTPGMRELQLESANLSRAFEDVEELAGRCRFADCTHTTEPGCAVRQAIEAGELPEDRFESYKKLQNELEFEEGKQTMTAAQAAKMKTIRMMGSLKAQKDYKKQKP